MPRKRTNLDQLSAANEDLVDELARMTASGGGLFKIAIFSRNEAAELVIASALGDRSAVGLLRAVHHCLRAIETAEAPRLCMTRPNELRTMNDVGTICVALPGMIDAPHNGLGACLCENCEGLSDLNSRVKSVLRQIWPNLTSLDISPGSGTVQ
jgi:hypothetical protein